MAMDAETQTLVVVSKDLRDELSILKVRLGYKAHREVIDLAIQALHEKLRWDAEVRQLKREDQN